MLSQNIVHYIPNIVHHRLHVCLIGQVITEGLGPPQPGPVLLLLLLLAPRLVALLGPVWPLEGEGVPHAANVATHYIPGDHWPLADPGCVFRHSNLCWSWRYGS